MAAHHRSFYSERPEDRFLRGNLFGKSTGFLASSEALANASNLATPPPTIVMPNPEDAAWLTSKLSLSVREATGSASTQALNNGESASVPTSGKCWT